MNVNIAELIQLLVGSGGFIAILVVMMRVGKVIEKIDNLSIRVKSIEDEQKGTNRTLSDLAIQMGRLETRVEERTLRVIHVEKNVEARGG